ncbi:hypothetical protein VPH35_078646 [Triticum aestivum]
MASYGPKDIMGHTWAKSYNGLESYWTAQMKLLGLILIGRNGSRLLSNEWMTSVPTHTCTIDSDDSDNDEGLYDLNCYPQYEGPLEEDSDTLPTTHCPKRLPVPVGGDNSSSSTRRDGKKRPKGSRSPTKKPPKTKSRFV